MSVNLLRSIPLFSSLDEQELASLSALLKRQTYSKHDTVFWIHEKGEHRYIIESGTVRISFTDREGQETDLAVLKQGSFFGELSLIDGGPHSATARAVHDSVLLTLDRASFYHFLTKHSKLAHALLEVLSQRLRANTAKVGGIVNANDQLDAERSSFQRSIDRLAKALTSGVFLTIYIVLVIGWMVVQTVFYKKSHPGPVNFLDDPPTFFILGFLITLTSFLLTLLILNSQRRQAESDRVRSDIEYQVNLKSQTEIMKLQLKMDELILLVNSISDQKQRVPVEE
jgi:CRP/FNR family transcriptional regulator, cyclic AMP receptor protein